MLSAQLYIKSKNSTLIENIFNQNCNLLYVEMIEIKTL
jgi:hypothetical protein